MALMKDLRIYIRTESEAMANDASRAKIVRRLEGEGWIGAPGGRHDVFKHPGQPGVTIAVPRHRTVSPGVARDISKRAGWI